MRYLLSCLFLLFSVSLVVTSCDPETPEPPNAEELITTLVYTLTPDDGGDVVTLIFRDLDGEGSDAPTFSTEPLRASTTYSGVITLSNEAEDPAEDITEEVKEEDDEHQLFYASSLSDLVVTYMDADAEGNPLGLATTLQTGTTGSGTLTIILRHEPAKDATGVSAGDITNAGGESDIEVTFNIDVE